MADTGSPTLAIGIFCRQDTKLHANRVRFLAQQADEVIVLDLTESDIHQEIGDIVNLEYISHPWGDSFADARNTLIQSVNSEYALFIEADENVGHATLRALNQYLVEPDRDPNAITVVRIDAFGEDEVPLDSSYQPRLWKMGQGIRYEGRVLEHLVSHRPIEYDYRDDIRIAHRPDDVPTGVMRDLRRLTQRLLNQEITQGGLTGRLRYHLGLQALVDEDFDVALREFEAIIDECDDADRVSSAYVMACECLRKMGRPADLSLIHI